MHDANQQRQLEVSCVRKRNWREDVKVHGLVSEQTSWTNDEHPDRRCHMFAIQVSFRLGVLL